MNGLLLTLKGSMRSWGEISIGDDRWTGNWPTASAVLGLAGACMGVDNHDPDQVTAWYNGFMVCTLSAVSYRYKHNSRFRDKHHPVVLSDFHTIRNSLNMNGKRRQDAIISHRGYLADSLDVAAIVPVHNAAEEWLEQLVFAVQQPCFTPYLGRRSNPLSAPLIEPEEKVVRVQSSEDLCELLFWRLSHLQTGEWLLAECMLRIPRQLQSESETFTKKWSFAGEEVVADHRAGFQRFFKNRTVCMYRRKKENQ